MDQTSGSRVLRSDNRPLYTRAIEALEELLRDGDYKGGDLLPPEGELARHLGISRSTLREAMSHLEKDGLVARRHGVGTFVASPSRSHFLGGLERLESVRSQAAAAGLQLAIVQREVSVEPADEQVAEALEVAPATSVVRVQVTEAIDGCRMAYLDGLAPADSVDITTLLAHGGSLLDYLAERADNRPFYTRSDIYAIDADRNLSERLQVHEGKSLLHLKEVFYDEVDRPLCLALNYFLTDYFNFYIVRRVISRPQWEGGPAHAHR